MTYEEQELLSIIRQAKANIECEEDLSVSDDIVLKVFNDKMTVKTHESIHVKRKVYEDGKI